MHQKIKTISGDQAASLRAIFDGYLKMRQRVDAVNGDLERFHARIIRLILSLLEARRQMQR